MILENREDGDRRMIRTTGIFMDQHQRSYCRRISSRLWLR
jgi:hypothetical protein